MYPYFVESKNTHTDLFRLSNGRFQMIKQGNLSKFMSGVDYILLDNKLADFLDDQDIPLIEFNQAIIWNRKLDKEYKNYKHLIVNNYMTEENVKYLDLRGYKMYIYLKNYLFVSPELKEKLQAAEFNYFKFSLGFSRFAA